MPDDPPSTRDRILSEAIEQFRRRGFVATTVEEICAACDVSKGAFFHHFAGKEAMGEACLDAWAARFVARDDSAPFREEPDAARRLSAAMAFYADLLGAPGGFKSCLAGTFAQEVAESHPKLRVAACACFDGATERFAALVRDAARATGADADASSLARLWTGTIQGALILAKSSQDPRVIGENLRHVQSYIEWSLKISST